MLDQTEKTLRKRLQQAEMALERSDRLAIASLYASATMHEVNNPLEAIGNLVYLTTLQSGEPEKVKENMLIIARQLETVGSITRQALAFHREQAGAREFDLVEIAECALCLHADKLRRHNVTVDRQFRGPALATVFGSEILQVLSNLILNSVDACSGGSGKLAVRVRTTRGQARILVADSGSGIPDAFAARLFEPYLTSKTSGTGIGLWLSQRIISRHQGSLRFRTSRKTGRTGTSFQVCLPISQAALTSAS